MADWWNPSTWFQQNNSTGQDPNQSGLDQASLEEDERKKRLQEAQGRLAAAKTQEEWQQIAGEYSDLGEQLGAAPSGLPSQADIDAQETLKQQLAGAKTQEEWQSILDGSNIPDKSQFALPQELPTQAGIDEQARIREAQQSPYTSTVEQESAAGAKNQYLTERDRQNDIWAQLQDQWNSIATINERFWAHREPYTLPITRDMVTNNPLELNLNGLRVQVDSPEEMAEMLRYMTDNRGFLPSGGTPLGGTGTMSFAQYKTAVENQQVLNTPEKELYDYWRVQMGVNRKYEDATSYFENKGYFVLGNEILNTDGQKMKVDDFRGIDAAYAERVMKGYTRRNPEAEDKLAEAYTQYADSVNQNMQPSWTLDPQERDVLTTPNGWKVYKGDQYNAAYYKDENGESYTAAQVLNDPALMKRFSESITPDMVKQFGQKVKANPDLLEDLVFQIGDTPETRALLDKTYPEYKANGVLDKYWEIVKKQRGSTSVEDKAQQVATQPKLTDGTPDPVAKPSNWQAFNTLWPEFVDKLATPDQVQAAQNIQAWLSGDRSDRVKNIGIDLLTVALPALNPANGLVAMTNIQQLVDGAFARLVYGVAPIKDTYEVWNTPGKNPFEDSPLNYVTTGAVPPLPVVGEFLAGTKEQQLSWVNPAYWIGVGEVAAAGKATQKAVAKAASLFAKGESKQAVRKAVTDYTKIIQRYDKYRQEGFKEIEAEMTNLDEAINAGDWTKAVEYESNIRQWEQNMAKRAEIAAEYREIVNEKTWDGLTYAVNNKDKVAAQNEFQRIRKEFEATGGLPEGNLEIDGIVNDAEKLVQKEIQKQISPDEITLPPRMVEPKPGAKVGDIVQTPEGPKQVETPVMRKADPNEPLPEGMNPADVYTDPVTNQKYVPKDVSPKETSGTSKDPYMTGEPVGDFAKFRDLNAKEQKIARDRFIKETGDKSDEYIDNLTFNRKTGEIMGDDVPATYAEPSTEKPGLSTESSTETTSSPTGKTGVQGETASVSKKLEPGQQPEKVGIEGNTEKPQGQMFENKPTTYRDLQEGKANIEKINADIETKKQNVKAAWDDFMAKSGERGAFSPDGDEAGKKLYGEMVDLAKLYVQKGYRTVEEFAKEMGIKVNDAVRAAWAEANGKARLAGYDNLSDDLRRKLRDIDVPEQQPIKEGFAGNIRLEKYGDEVQDLIKEWAEAHPGQVANARRGIRSDAEVLAEGQRLAEEVGSGFYKKTQNWKPGQAWNAEEITALRGSLESKSNEVLELSKAITEGGDTTKDMLRLVTALEEHTNLQKALTGVTAETGRALRSFRQAAFDSLKANDTQRMEELLKRIGDKKDIQKVAEALSKLDVSDPVAVNSFIRSVTKPKAGDYLLEIYYNSILSGVRTHLANFSSNTLNAVLSPFERAGAALVDLPLSALQGRSRQRFFGEAAQDIFGMVRGIPEGLRGALYVLKNGYTVEQAGKWEVRTQAFTGKLGAVINAPTRALLAADQLGYAINRTAALRAEAYRLASLEKVNGKNLKGQQFLDRLEDLFANPTEEMLKNAHARAEKRLFREEPGKLTGAIMNLREKSGIGKFIIPFVRTPANLVKYGIERSPLGIANPDLWKALKAKDPAGAEMVANWLIGSTAATALTLYALDGKITGAPPLSSAEKDEFYRSGKQPYSVKIGDYWVSYQRMEPFNQMFAQVAAFVEAVNNKKNDKDVTKMAGQIAATIGSNFISQTYMEGLSDFLDAFEDPLRYGNKWINRFASGFVPYSGLQRTITQAIDKTIRQPKDIGQTIQAQTPGLSQNVPAKINIYGEADIRESSAFLPLNITSAKNDPVDKALLAADLTPGFVGNSISNIKLDETQHYEYQLLAGQIMRDNLERFIESNPRRDWSSPAGQMVLSRIVSTSQTQARNEYLRILSTRGIKPPKK